MNYLVKPISYPGFHKSNPGKQRTDLKDKHNEE